MLTGHDAKYPGIYLGIYKVHVSRLVKGKEAVPYCYNQQTTLGFEAADDIKNISTVPQFHLQNNK